MKVVTEHVGEGEKYRNYGRVERNRWVEEPRHRV